MTAGSWTARLREELVDAARRRRVVQQDDPVAEDDPGPVDAPGPQPLHEV